ncbi:MAG: outer membrane beta-barrel protein [Spirochaetaceae bacterium]|jgi:opacity protein-like surface antigen|nr:outer membrane beta-barrel protein [Spirochaetaceae bacterium]
MAKKSLAVFIIAALAASGIFAQEQEQPKGFSLSAGAGALIGGDFGGGVKATGSEFKTPYFGGGGFLFFDATYAELSFGILGGGGKWGGDDTENATITNLNIGLLGKYPFAINEKLSVFPLLGIDYQITVSAKIDGEEYKHDGDDSPGDFSALWFKLGGGLDYDITSNLYLRGELLYGLRLANKAENDMKDGIPDGADPKTRLGHGLNVKIAVGYKF